MQQYNRLKKSNNWLLQLVLSDYTWLEFFGFASKPDCLWKAKMPLNHKYPLLSNPEMFNYDSTNYKCINILPLFR